ncbi:MULTISPECIES: dethiobiotin synthase [Anoxybacillus]|uniref:dethiobiotin synthase n=1 Tax=Anoxybacillus TaxID=150247 RepID=UPI0018660017|nr:dethiobiotin synthase [Anoxybacillus flavithermus]MBE2939658.1 dethiobiotin synthase [Anoxybacillus flavithermus]MBE2942186.1 dethiobiotin synthase [Anoxybacillus flavithermus]MBE2950477.1 dethiobiotin synthase [Anoxybacillus flavithermus]MBE2953082.1 dethiobiotin synthase [Anoxybacillus flavithermus]
MKGFFITGTDTDVGKTFVTVCMLRTLMNKQIRATAYKPIQSGAQWQGGKWVAPDVEMYRQVIDVTDEEGYTYLLQTPCSPHLAARMDGVTIEPSRIVAHVKKLQQTYDFVLVEGAGGIAVPLVDESFLVAHLAQALSLPLIIVARASVGTINHTVLTVEYARAHGLHIAGIIMNGFSTPTNEIERDNIRMIETMTGVPVIGNIPHMPDGSCGEVVWRKEWWQ